MEDTTEAPEGGAAGDIETVVRDFYDRFGWVKAGDQSGEDALFRQFPEHYHRVYEPLSFSRLLSCFDGAGGRLLIAGCGDLPDNHVTIARRFAEISCLDISQRALASASAKMGHGASYVHGSLLAAPFPAASFDAVLCAHVLYHIDAAEQARAVGELIRVTKPGGRVVIVYSNPDSIFALQFWRRFRLGGVLARRLSGTVAGAPPLYFACHPLAWWRQFEATCGVGMVASDVMGSRQARLLLRHRLAAVAVYRLAAWVERAAPATAVRLWQYPIVILTKRAE